MQPVVRSIKAIIAEIDRLKDATRKRRLLVGIGGGPGSGKSTLAGTLLGALNARGGQQAAAYLSMDGFHYNADRLLRLCLTEVKGSIETFDVPALLSTVQALVNSVEPLAVPDYSRKVHDVIPNARVINEEPIVILEGNYVLDSAPLWRDIRAFLDLRIFLEVDWLVARQRLIGRYVSGGRTVASAINKVDSVDYCNFISVSWSKQSADLVAILPDALPDDSSDL